MAMLSFGEGYHNFHHSFPFDYRNGIKRWHFDPAKCLIVALSRLGLAGNLRRASDAAILRAKVEMQFETTREKIERMVSGARESYEAPLHQGYARLQAALRELLDLQRRPARETAAGDDLPETRLGMIQHSLEKALREWLK